MKNITLFICFFVLAHSYNAPAQGGIWTWMHGSKYSFNIYDYGTKGVPSMTNEPPQRYQCCYWTDLNGNFWMFGGVLGKGAGNDLWKYDVNTNMWTWMNGPDCINSPNAAGVYGVQGIPSVNNYPSGRGWGANCWTDLNGNLWLYGGSSGGNDLWKYTIATNMWTWVNGVAAPTPAIFGTMGFPAISNTPGSLQEVKSAWVDANNNLWMFGGQGNSSMISVLWKYTIATNMWTWMKGSTVSNAAGNYGTYRVPNASNEPPSRFSYTRWKDAQDNFYLFGGGNGLYSNSGMFNDVWKYNKLTNNWAWVSGSNQTNDTGHFPPLKCHFYDSLYFPPSRMENQTAYSINSCSKAFWTFGGFNYALSNYWNDLWLFDTDSFKWSWISGSNLPNSTGSYGILGVPNVTNSCPARGGHAIWTDQKNNLWVFGGLKNETALLNDLWRFQPDTACINVTSLFGGHLNAPDTNICKGDTSFLYIGTHHTVFFTPNSSVTFNADTSILKFSPPVTTSYTVNVTGGTCTPNDTLHFTIHPITDSIHLPIPPHIKCISDTLTIPINPNWTVSVSPNTYVSYQPTGGNKIQFFNTVNTNYTVVAKSPNKCTSGDSITFAIQMPNFLEASFTVNPPVATLANPAFYLNNTSSGATDYKWFVDGQYYTNQMSPTINFNDTGVHCFMLVASNFYNCNDTAINCGKILEHSTVFVPSAFSPNNDGKNDVLTPYLNGCELSHFSIFNRFGEQVFKAIKINQGWDGTFNGQQADMGVYYYYLKYKIGTQEYELKGDITLIR